MSEEFDRKIVVVTGASRGIGKTIAQEFSKHGSTTICLATRKENCSVVVDEIRDASGHTIAFGCRVEISNEVTETFEAIS